MRIIGAGTFFPEIHKDKNSLSKPYYYPKPSASDNDLMADWAIDLCTKVLYGSECNPSEIDLIISASVSPDHLVEKSEIAAPRLCHPLQRDLNAKKAFVFDMIDADWASMLEVAEGFSISQGYIKILLIRTEITTPSYEADEESGFSLTDGAGVLLLSFEKDIRLNTKYRNIKTSYENACIEMLSCEEMIKGNKKVRITFPFEENRVSELNKAAKEIIEEQTKNPLDTMQIIAESWLPGHNIQHGVYKSFLNDDFIHLGPFSLPYYASRILKTLRRYKSEEPTYKIMNLSFNPFLYRYGYNLLSI